MDQFWQVVIPFAGQVLAVGTSAATIAYFVFKHLGEKWLDSIFAVRLQKLKTEQDEYLKRVQTMIDREFHRAKRLYDGEFDSLLKAWNLCCNAFYAAANLRFEHRDYNLGGLNEAEERDMLEHRFRLAPHDVAAVLLKKSVEARSKLANLLREQSVSTQVHEALSEFSNCRSTYAIFWNTDIASAFKALELLIARAASEYHHTCVGEPFANRKFEHVERLVSDGTALKDSLELMVRARIWSADRKEGP